VSKHGKYNFSQTTLKDNKIFCYFNVSLSVFKFNFSNDKTWKFLMIQKNPCILETIYFYF